MSTITVTFFGPARDLAGTSALSLDIADGETVGEIAGRLAEKHPSLGAALGIRLAVNKAYVPLDHKLSDGDEIAVIMPVSGGSPAPRARLTREPIDVDTIIGEIRTPSAGAAVTFVGTVREEQREDLRLVALDYHAYEEMAVEQMEAICRRAGEHLDILDAMIVHRLGRLELGETSIVIAVAAAHRGPAFEACRWILDQVKTDVPIWKKDLWADGSETWVDPTRP